VVGQWAGVGGRDRCGGVEFFGEELEGAGHSWALGRSRVMVIVLVV
jgi:hypothetical protein